MLDIVRTIVPLFLLVIVFLQEIYMKQQSLDRKNLRAWFVAKLETEQSKKIEANADFDKRYYEGQCNAFNSALRKMSDQDSYIRYRWTPCRRRKSKGKVVKCNR